jgi:WD40 repeat protein
MRRRRLLLGAGVLVALVAAPACYGQEPWAILHPTLETWEVTADMFFTMTVNAVAFSPDGKMLAVGCEDGRVELWEVLTGRRRATLRQHRVGVVSALGFSPDSRALASGGSDKAVQLWHPFKARSSARVGYTLLGHTHRVRSLAFGPDTRVLASSDYDRTVRLWQLPTGEEQAAFEGKSFTVGTSLAFSRDGKAVAVGGTYIDRSPPFVRGEVLIVDTSSGKATNVFRAQTGGVQCLAFSSDGDVLVSATTTSAMRRSWPAGECKGSFAWPEDGEHLVTCVGLSPDAARLAVCRVSDRDRSRQGICRLWDVATGKKLAAFPGQARFLTAVAFSPDGRMLALGGGDGTVSLWNVAAVLKAAK